METLAYLHLVESYDYSQFWYQVSASCPTRCDRPSYQPISTMPGDRPLNAAAPHATATIEPLSLHPVCWMMP
ncbi:MAG TPA: hypothetical protein IGS37_12835 [Synechococcales cyanobacterium M55_K2018_004]|nr:hypothetical protein [Synechococcales cyanobacterium M55_K2018_004]